MRSQQGILSLKGMQLLRLMYRHFRTTESLSGISAMTQLSKARWLGDSQENLGQYYRLIEDIFDELTLPDIQRRDLMAQHMANNKDKDITSDMYEYRRSADGDRRSYTYQYLKQSLMRKLAHMGFDAQNTRIAAAGTAFTRAMDLVDQAKTEA